MVLLDKDKKDITIITNIITIKVIKISNNGTCRQVAGTRRSCQIHTGRSPRPEADAPDGLFTPQVSFLELDKGAHKKRTLVVAQFYSRDNKHKHKTSCAALSGLCTIFLVATKLRHTLETLSAHMGISQHNHVFLPQSRQEIGTLAGIERVYKRQRTHRGGKKGTSETSKRQDSKM